MPRLTQLSISVASEGPFFGPRWAFTYTQALMRVVIECVLTYPIPPSPIVQLPRVRVWWATLEPRRGDQGWLYRIKDEDTDDDE